MSNFGFDFDSNADEDFFGTLRNKSSKLQQLFDGDSLPEADKQQSLKYQRPKVTNSKSPPAAAAAHNDAVSTLIAKVATAYRQRQLQGKVGVALVKTTEDNLQIVLYKSKENVLATLQLYNDKRGLFKQGNYWQFYDDLSQMDWSYCFDLPADDVEFKNVLQQNGHKNHDSAVDDKKENTPKSPGPDEEVKENNDSGDVVDLFQPLPRALPATNSSSAKSSLIQRIAKMGQPLPNLPKNNLQTTTEFSDSSDEEEVVATPLAVHHQSAKPSIAPRSNKLGIFKAMQKQVAPSSSATTTTTTVALNQATTPVFSTISTNNFESQYMQMLLSEQRTQGSELRMNVTKLESKIEKVLDRLEDMERGSSGGGGVITKERKHKDDEILELEEKILNLKKENRKLKQAMDRRQSSSECKETYDEKSREILENLADDLNDLSIKQGNNLEKVLKDCLESLHDKKQFIAKQQNIIENLKKDKQKDIKKSLENQLREMITNIETLKTDAREKDNNLREQRQEIHELKLARDAAKATEAQQSPQPMDSILKEIMNNLYADICSKLTPEVCGGGDMDMVRSLVGASIKQQTLKALKHQRSVENH